MHFNLLILCVFLSQAIVGTFSSENISESSDLLVRKKRVINREPGGDLPASSGEFPYVVNIKMNNIAHCVGSILSSFTVITSAYCASQNISMYQVFSGSISLYRGSPHNVVAKKIRFGNHSPARASDGIALLTIDPPFFPRFTSTVQLHVGPLLAGLHATIPGWGCYYLPTVRGTEHPRQLRSITVPIMSHRECVDVYRGIYDITDEDFCIYAEQKHCGNTDSGAPLVIDGQLAGVYLKKAEYDGYRPDPEIFVVLQHAHYRQWIRDNIIIN